MPSPPPPASARCPTPSRSEPAAVTGVAIGVVICAAESLLFRTVIGVPGPGTIPVINRLIAPNQAYVMVGGWVLAAAAGVLLAAARSGVVGWSTRPETPPDDGAAVMAAIGLVLVAVPLSILAVSGEPGAISSWRAGAAGATAAAIGGGLALLGRRRLPLARTVLLAYAASFGAEVVLVRAVGRISTAAWVEGSGSPAARIAQATAFSSTWAVAAYAAAGALGAAVAMAAAPGTAAKVGPRRRLDPTRRRHPGSAGCRRGHPRHPASLHPRGEPAGRRAHCRHRDCRRATQTGTNLSPICSTLLY